MKKLLAMIVGLLVAGPVWAQAHGTIPACSQARVISGLCAPEVGGASAYATDTDDVYTYTTGGDWHIGVPMIDDLNYLADIVTSTGDTDSPSAAEMRGALHIADHGTATSDVDYTLPEISTIGGAGASACFYDNGGGDGGIIIDAAAGDDILLDGISNGVAQAIDSPGVAGAGANGDYICIVAINNTYWLTMGRSGVWVPGGAD